MKKALVALLLLVVVGGTACLALFVWELHPWVSAGTALQLGKWQLGDYEFQVWQRKNKSALEPFADGLFVRRGTNDWQAFCFDIQDNYSPKICYGCQNRLVQATMWGVLDGGKEDMPLATSYFAYDGLSRLRKRTEAFWVVSSSQWSTNAIVFYIYDGQRVTQERNSANTPSVSYMLRTCLTSYLRPNCERKAIGPLAALAS